MVEPNRAEVRDRLIPRYHRRLVDPVRERRWGTAEQVWRRWIKDPDHVVGRCRHVGIEVIADMTELGGGEIVDVIRRSQETQFLTAEPDETQLVQRVDVLHHLSDIQDRRGTRRVVQHSGAVNRVQVRVDNQDMVFVTALCLGDNVVVVGVRVDDGLDVDAHDRQRRSILDRLLVLVEQVVTDVKGRESDGNRRDNPVPRGVHQAACQYAGAAGVALVEDDYPCSTSSFGIEHLHPKVAGTTLDEGDSAWYEAAEITRSAAA